MCYYSPFFLPRHFQVQFHAVVWSLYGLRALRVVSAVHPSPLTFAYSPPLEASHYIAYGYAPFFGWLE